MYLFRSCFLIISLSLLAFIFSSLFLVDQSEAGISMLSVSTLDDMEFDDCATGECTLREAINDINITPGTIDFANLPGGSLPGTINLDPAKSQLVIDKNLSIDGPGADMLAISGQNMNPVFEIDMVATNVIISGLNIVDGESAMSGGCIINDGTLTIAESVISGCNSGDDGGGILNSGSLIINSSNITGNTTDGGDESDGAGIFNDGTLTVNDSTISNNIASDDIGGILHLSGTFNLNNSTVSGNSNDGTSGATFNTGGGLGIAGGTTNVTNSTISGNTSADDAGGLIVQGGTVNILNTTITNNTGDLGAALRHDMGTINIENSIVSGNISTMSADENCSFMMAATFNDNGNNLEDGMDCGFTGVGSLQDTDPLLGPLVDNGGSTFTHILLPGSEAIDLADTCGLATDQRGENREATACDSGAVEVQKADLTITKDTNPPGLIGFDFISDLVDDLCTPMLTAGAFTLEDGESIMCTITEGTYNVTEMIPGDTTLSIDCAMEPAGGVTVNNATGALDFTTAPGDASVDCTFTNTSTTNFTLNVIKAGSGSGTVTGPVGDPPDGGIDCGVDCEEGYDSGTDVDLDAMPDLGSEFQGWSGDCNENGEVVVDSNKTCIATFIPEGGAPVLNPGDPIEIAQLGDDEVDQDGEATLILNFRNATAGDLNDVTLTVLEEQMVVKLDSTVTRFDPTNIFLEPDIGICNELADRVVCDLAVLMDDVDLIIDFEAVDVEEGDFDIPVEAESDDLFGIISEAIARMRVIGDSGSGCSVAPASSEGLGSIVIFALIPAVMLFRRLRKNI